MFPFMLDAVAELPDQEKHGVSAIEVEVKAPDPVCIHNCNTPNPEQGYPINPRRNRFICPNCLEDFDQMCHVDRVARNLHVLA